MTRRSEEPALELRGIGKRFVLHAQGGAEIQALDGIDFRVFAGECVGLVGPSGAGKSTLMRLVWGTYRCEAGSIRVRADGVDVDLATADARAITRLRRTTLGHVSQFLRVMPRVPAVEIVAEPLITLGVDRPAALERAGVLLARLAVPEALWGLSPVTFSGGEQQRVNLARGFAHPYPILLIDEPTASLDPANRETALALLEEAKGRGAAILGIFHDAGARDRLCDRLVEMRTPVPRAPAPRQVPNTGPS